MNTGDKQLDVLAREVGRSLEQAGWRLATAESCTGGWIAKLITDVAGSSGWFERGFVVYSNAAKADMLGVAEATLTAHGAVSEATVREMAAGALVRGKADIACAVTGIAGPDGGTADKPVGTVWFGWAWGTSVDAVMRQLEGDRDAVRRQALAIALAGVLERALRQ